MNVAERICRAPVGLAAIVMAIMSAAAWGNLTLLQRGALAQVEAEIRPLVSGLTALGNLLSATTILAFWPLVTLALRIIETNAVMNRTPPRNHAGVCYGMLC